MSLTNVIFNICGAQFIGQLRDLEKLMVIQHYSNQKEFPIFLIGSNEASMDADASMHCLQFLAAFLDLEST